jgi:hypothetical protein
MKFWRAITFGALLWVLIFFEVSVLMFGFGLTSGRIYYLVHYIVLIFLAGFVSHFYFRKGGAGAKEGFLLGIVMMLTGILLDAIITIPLFIKSYSFFADIYLWIGIAEGVVITTIVGALKKLGRKL